MGGYDFEVVVYDFNDHPDVFQGTIDSGVVVKECAWDQSGIARDSTDKCNLSRAVLDLLYSERMQSPS